MSKPIDTVAFTTTESSINMGNDFIGYDMVVVMPDTDVLISVNDNASYNKYPANKILSIPGKVNILYVKGASGSGNLQYWAFK